MGRQVRFRLGDRDVAMLQEYLQSVDAVFVPWRSDSPVVGAQPDLRPQPGLAAGPWIVHRSDVADLTRYLVEAQGYWLVDRHSCPILDFSRGRLDLDPLSYGRIYFETVVKRDERWTPVSEDFIEWASGILDWVRRTFTYDREHQLYLGPDAIKVMGAAAPASDASEVHRSP